MTENESTPEKPVSAWPLPQLSRGGKKIYSANREKQEKSKESVEHVSRAQRPKHLTAKDIEEITQQAEKEGREAGYAEGFAQGEIQGEKLGVQRGEEKAYKEKLEELEAQQNKLTQICENLFAPMDEQSRELENIVLDLVHNLSQKILKTEITQNPEQFKGFVSRVMRELPAGSKNITVFLNPEDAEVLKDLLKSKNQNWPIESDDDMAHGGCRVETRESIVDYSLEKRWLELLEDAAAEEDNNEI